MWRDGKITETFRCKLVQAPGGPGPLLATVGEQGGLIGEIRIVTIGSRAVTRVAVEQGLNRDGLTGSFD